MARMNSNGTEEDIRHIVETYSSMLLHIAMTRLHSPADAEDAVQEVFLKLLTLHPRFRDEEHQRAWLIRATIHRASDIRKAADNNHTSLDDPSASEPSYLPDEPSPLLSAVQSLPEKYSAVIHLFYYEGYSIKEIARLLGLPAPTVGTRLSRGRKLLQKLLKEDYDEPQTISRRL